LTIGSEQEIAKKPVTADEMRQAHLKRFGGDLSAKKPTMAENLEKKEATPAGRHQFVTLYCDVCQLHVCRRNLRVKRIAKIKERKKHRREALPVRLLVLNKKLLKSQP